MKPASRAVRISVVIPIHDEAACLTEAVASLFAELEGVDAEVDVTLVENGSTDGTGELADELTARYAGLAVLRLPQANYGAAMRAGFLATDGDWRVNFDIDYFSGDFLREVLRQGDGADLVLASKLKDGSVDRRSALRRLATRVLNACLHVLFRSLASDTHGMKAIRGEVLESLAPAVVSTQDLFDTELVLRAERAGYRVVEVPARVEEQRPSGQGLLARVPRTLAGLARLRLLLWRERRAGRK